MYRKNPLIQLLKLKWITMLLIVALAAGYAFGQSVPTPPPVVPHNIGLNLIKDGSISTIRVTNEQALLILNSPWTIDGETVGAVEWKTNPGPNYITHALNDMQVPQRIRNNLQLEFPSSNSSSTAALPAELVPVLFLSVTLPLLYISVSRRPTPRQIEDGMRVSETI